MSVKLQGLTFQFVQYLKHDLLITFSNVISAV